MGKIRTEIEESINGSIDYYKRRILNLRRDLSNRKTFDVFDRLDLILESMEEVDAQTSLSSVTFMCSNREISRELCSKIMDKFKLKQIDKTFYTYSNEVTWYYQTYVNQIEIKVFPCEPSPDCNPIKIVRTYEQTKWVCEQTGKEL